MLATVRQSVSVSFCAIRAWRKDGASNALSLAENVVGNCKKTLKHLKPHIAFWSLIPLAIAYGQWNKYGPFDNGTHNSPMIIHQMTFALIVSTLFLYVGIIYWASKKVRQSSWTGINLAHWVLTTIGFVGFWLYGFAKIEMNVGREFLDIVGYGRFDIINTTFLVLIFASQLLLFLNRNRKAVK